MDEPKIHEQIKAAREKKGWSQAQLAEKLGVQQSRISELETGVSNPSKEMLEAIAEALGKYWKLTGRSKG